MPKRIDATEDFRDFLRLFEKHKVRYLIVGAYAFAYHAIPRYTKDLDIFIEPKKANIEKANQALAEFGSPWLLSVGHPDEIVQIGIEPNRIDILKKIPNVRFEKAWRERECALYTDVMANWIGLESLIKTKEGTDRIQDKEDLKILKKLLKERNKDTFYKGNEE
ncbi:MAG: hypothetical protein AB1630_12030 [bacterium]